MPKFKWRILKDSRNKTAVIVMMCEGSSTYLCALDVDVNTRIVVGSRFLYVPIEIIDDLRSQVMGSDVDEAIELVTTVYTIEGVDK